MNVIAVSVRQAKGNAKRLCLSATACLRSTSVLASAANCDISPNDICLSSLELESLLAPLSILGSSTSLTVDLANNAVDCEDVEPPCALGVEAGCPPYFIDTPLKSCASRANDSPDSILNCPR